MTRMFLLLTLATACAGEAAVNFYDDVPLEPSLTPEERAVLPEDHEAIHAGELEIALARLIVADDAAAYDDDVVEPFVDAEVLDDAPANAAGPLGAQLLHFGLHPRASDALRAAGVSASRITQTIGNAPASAGTHAQDGTVNGAPYSAATDISVRNLGESQIHNLVEKLAKVGFAVWYRKQGFDGWNGANHIHVVYANSKMKSALRSQVRSWLAGRNGLVSNTTYRWHTFSASAKATVKGKFQMSSEGTSNGGAGISARVNTAGTALRIRSSPSTSAAVVGEVADGAYITISCQRHGSSVTGTYGTTTLWDRVAGGYVSDAFVATGSDGQVAPTCN